MLTSCAFVCLCVFSVTFLCPQLWKIFALSMHASSRQSVTKVIEEQFEISYMDSSSKNNWHVFF